jgi:hypothetical protein
MSLLEMHSRNRTVQIQWGDYRFSSLGVNIKKTSKEKGERKDIKILTRRKS